MASSVALNDFSEAEKMIGDEHSPQKAEVISLRDKPKALLRGEKSYVEVDGRSLPVVINGNCTAEELNKKGNRVVDRFKLSDLLTAQTVQSDAELPEHDFDNEVLQKITIAEKMRDTFRLFVSWLQNPHITFEDFLKITKKQYKGVKQQTQPTTKQYSSISLKDLKEKLGLSGNEYLLFSNSHFVNVLSASEPEDCEIRNEDNMISLKRGNAFYPFGSTKDVEEVLVMANTN